MKEEFLREALILGEGAIERLNCCRVAVFGLGGVGGYVVEGLARAGVGTLDLFDGDVFSRSNINRQLLALNSTVGLPKVAVAKGRVNEINPDICVNEHQMFFNSTTQSSVDFSVYDYVVDAIDEVSAKLLIIERCKQKSVSVISCMGTGNKLDPSAFKVADISKTKVCPLARVMRKELKARGIEGVKVVYSEEEPKTAVISECGRHVPGSVSFVPPAAGFLLASQVIKDLLNI